MQNLAPMKIGLTRKTAHLLQTGLPLMPPRTWPTATVPAPPLQAAE